MLQLLSGLRLPAPGPADTHALTAPAARALGLSEDQLTVLAIQKRSLDARGRKAHHVYTLEVELADGAEPRPARGVRLRTPPPPLELRPLAEPWRGSPPVVVGAGPAGLLAAWQLARLGAPPIVLERGQPVEQRGRDVKRFWRTGTLDPESNAVFGEGGAGTFSDGKIYTRIRDQRIRQVLEYLVQMGALPTILTDARPHIGTDRLKTVLMRMRADLARRGVDFRFGVRATGLLVHRGRVVGVRLEDGTELSSPAVIVAPGHSARDTFRWLAAAGVSMEARPTAVGARIEHPQPLIDRAQHGAQAGHLPPASYRLSYRPQRGERAVFSFCMCPGGQVIAATAQPGRVVVNGMSNSSRGGRLANSAMVAQVAVEDYAPFGAASDPLRGFAFQDHFEARCFEAAGGDYRAPAQRVGSFLAGRPDERAIDSTYRPGVVPTRLDELLPEIVTRSLRAALPRFDRRIHGFTGADAHLVGIESRTSSPVRILRDRSCQNPAVRGLFPAGEGAGYAGGIISAAVDGMVCAEALVDSCLRTTPAAAAPD